MRMLAARLAPAGIETAGAVGWSAEALEAQAFAYLAGANARGLAAHVSHDDRRATADDRRCPRAVMRRMAFAASDPGITLV